MKETWIVQSHCLIKNFKFHSFEDALKFMVDASVFINKMNHHPEWTNIYNQILIKLTTHDEGNQVTKKDWELAEKLDDLYLTYL